MPFKIPTTKMQQMPTIQEHSLLTTPVEDKIKMAKAKADYAAKYGVPLTPSPIQFEVVIELPMTPTFEIPIIEIPSNGVPITEDKTYLKSHYRVLFLMFLLGLVILAIIAGFSATTHLRKMTV